MSEISRRQLLKGIAVAGAAVAVATPAEAAEARARQPSDVGLLFDSTRCIGCRACVTKCKEANELPPDPVQMNGAAYNAPTDLSATTKTIVQLATGAGSSTAFIKKQCMHCLEPACVTACMIKAFRKGANGIVTYEVSRCLGDRYCQVACPFNVPKFEWSKAFPVMVKCEMCRHRKEGPACSEVCPRQAVTFGKVPDILADARARQAASPGKYAAKIYGEHEAGGTQCLYLAPASMPFEKLGMPKLEDTSVPRLSTGIQHSIYQYFAAPAALYAVLGFVVWRNRKAEDAKKEEHK